MSETEQCGATRDHMKGTEWEGKIVSVCEKPKGHSNKGPHKGTTTGQKGGTVQWRGDDRG